MNQFKQIWSDFWRNIFNPNAPITRDLYMRERWLLFIFIIPLLLLWLYYSNTNSLYTDEFYKMSVNDQQLLQYKENFILSIIIILITFILFILSCSLELRMYKYRGKSPRIYFIVNALFFIIALSYCLIAYFSGHDIYFGLVILGYAMTGFAAQGNVTRTAS